MTERGPTLVVPFEPHRFRSAIPYYLRSRIAYPDELIASVARHCGTRLGSRVLDLGCGPGQLAIAFARLGATVTAMDPDSGMLALARERAAEIGVTLSYVEGSSYDLSPSLGRFHLVTMGRSFHWMDRDATLSALDELVEPGGAVVLFFDRRTTSGGNWRELLDRLREEFAPAQAAERRRRKQREPQASVLLRSAFSRIESYGVTLSRALSPDEIIEFVYSLPDTTPEILGTEQPAFERKLREGLAQMAPQGGLGEIAQIVATIATRPTREPAGGMRDQA